MKTGSSWVNFDASLRIGTCACLIFSGRLMVMCFFLMLYIWLRTLLCSRFYKYTGSSNAHCIDMSHSLRIGGPKCIVFRRWFMWWSWWSFHQEDCLTVETKGRRMKRRYCQSSSSSQQCQSPNPNLTLTPPTNSMEESIWYQRPSTRKALCAYYEAHYQKLLVLIVVRKAWKALHFV